MTKEEYLEKTKLYDGRRENEYFVSMSENGKKVIKTPNPDSYNNYEIDESEQRIKIYDDFLDILAQELTPIAEDTLLKRIDVDMGNDEMGVELVFDSWQGDLKASLPGNLLRELVKKFGDLGNLGPDINISTDKRGMVVSIVVDITGSWWRE